MKSFFYRIFILLTLIYSLPLGQDVHAGWWSDLLDRYNKEEEDEEALWRGERYTPSAREEAVEYKQDPIQQQAQRPARRAKVTQFSNEILKQEQDYTENVLNKPAVVCRSHSCTRLNNRITEAFLFNSIIAMFYSNQKTKVSICEADPATRSCVHKGIRFGAEIGGTPAVIKIPSFSLTDLQISKKLKYVDFAVSYDVYANGLMVNCNTAKNNISIKSSKTILMTGDTFFCQLTSDVPSTLFNLFNIDYVDLDYGIMGGYYSIGISGSSKGQKRGYMLMKFQGTDQRTNFDKLNQTRTNNLEKRIPPGQYEVVPYEGKK